MEAQYFTVNEAVILQRATTYAQLADIAVRQLQRLRQNSVRLPGIVCGPISSGGLGSISANIARFELVVNHFIAQNHGTFFSQIPFEESLWRIQAAMKAVDPTVHPKGEGNPLLEGFYRPIFTSGLVGAAYFIKDWESSAGARWERALCLALGITIFDLDDKLNRTLLRV